MARRMQVEDDLNLGNTQEVQTSDVKHDKRYADVTHSTKVFVADSLKAMITALE